MTGPSPADFAVTVHATPPTLSVGVAGELDYDTCDEFLDTVTRQLADHGPALREVRLDFRGMTWIDSSGLSALIMVHRRTAEFGAVLRLDNRPRILERILTLTDVRDHLTAGEA
ncbi:STAS domain-containing protein [Kitasatospora sp. NPDC015120]|uniref:STAS domain-containing protein n=1 Tax=Kitasatospora sp. NPDC015120 TaxID=3364023 RepID=UPI0036F44F9E